MSNDASLDINQKSNPVQTVAPLKEDNNMLRATDKITALYCRLSVEDTKEKGGKDDPSNSIQHQQIMLMEYAKSQHFPNPTFFIDDGYSGVDFSNRPGFQKMLAAGVFGKKLVKPVLDARNIAVGTVGVDGVKVVVDGNIPNIVLREREVDIQSGQRRISSQSG